MINQFQGNYTTTIDAKGRLAVPVKIRTAFEEAGLMQMVVTVDAYDKCLLVYTPEQWKAVDSSLNQMPNLGKRVRNLQRKMIGNAYPLEPDANGRILLPLASRKYAELDKKVVFVGQGNKIEIWSEENWDMFMQDDSDPNEPIPNEVLNSISI